MESDQRSDVENVPVDLESLIEIELEDDEDFLKIRETLTRIGIASRKDRTLFQSCHILHKRGKYYIVHFKELFLLDGLPSNMDEIDLGRRNRIALLLEEWGLLEVVDQERCKQSVCDIAQLKILSYKEKGDWELIPKYHIGRK